MVNRLVQFLRASGAPGETVDAWLPAPSPFQDQDSPRCRTGRAHWVLGGGQKRECQNQGSDRRRDRDKSLAENSHNATLLEGINQVRLVSFILSNCPPIIATVMVN